MVTPRGVTPSEAKICICAVYVPAGSVVGISCVYVSVVGVVLMYAVVVTTP